jgi:hypothetical protein
MMALLYLSALVSNAMASNSVVDFPGPGKVNSVPFVIRHDDERWISSGENEKLCEAPTLRLAIASAVLQLP